LNYILIHFNHELHLKVMDLLCWTCVHPLS